MYDVSVAHTKTKVLKLQDHFHRSLCRILFAWSKAAAAANSFRSHITNIKSNATLLSKEHSFGQRWKDYREDKEPTDTCTYLRGTIRKKNCTTKSYSLIRGEIFIMKSKFLLNRETIKIRLCCLLSPNLACFCSLFLSCCFGCFGHNWTKLPVAVWTACSQSDMALWNL